MNKKLFHRGLCLLLCMLMLCADTVSALGEEGMAVLTLPQKLSRIEKEAFADAQALEKVIVQDGTKRIESRAFAGSGAMEIHLPESVEYIADDAFEGCENLKLVVHRDSYAHRWVSGKDIWYTIVEPAGEPGGEAPVYIIHSVEYVEKTDEENQTVNYFLMEADTGEVCAARVDIYEEDKDAPVLSFQAEADAALGNGEIRLGEDEDFTLPEYYVLKAYLVLDGEEMCDPYTDSRHSRAYADTMNKTADDYVGSEIITFGSAGYAVLAEGVISVSGATATGGGYTFSAANAVSVGDVLMLNVAGKNKAVKVASIQNNNDGTVTVLPDEDICLADAFERLQVDGYMEDTNNAGISTAAEGDVKVIPLSPGFTYGPVEVKGTMQIAIKMKVVFDKKDDFFEMECWVENQGNVEVTLKTGFNTRDFKVNPLQIPLYNAGVTIPHTDIEAMLTVSVPLDVNLEVGGTTYFGFKSKTGFSYNSTDDVFNKIKDKSGEAYAKVLGKVTATFGPQVMLKAQLMEMLDAKLWGQVGVEAVGELTGLEYGGSVSEQKPDSIHACDACLDCDVNFIAGVWGTLEYEVTEKIKGKFLDSELLVARVKLCDAYYSFENEVESPYGGEESHGFTECENVKYRADITTKDYQGKELKGKNITSTGVYGTVQKGVSPCSMYLYEGSNKLEAEFDSGIARKNIHMNACPASFTLEDKISLLVTVQEGYAPNEGEEENYTPIPGATITITMPNGKKQTATTGADGTYLFEALPGGENTINVKVKGRDEKTTKMKYVPGTSNSAIFTLEPNPVIVIPHTLEGSASAQAESGKYPDSVPGVTMTVTNNSYGFTKKVSVKVEGVSKAYVYELDTGAAKGAELFGVPTKKGDYVYVLSVWCSGTGGGSYTKVFRNVNGVLKTIKTLDHTGIDGISASGKFTGPSAYNGAIQPTGRTFSGDVQDNFKRTGKPLEDAGLGGMSYAIDENGLYDLIYSLRCTSDMNIDSIGSAKTRYIIKDDGLEMDSQWFDCWSGVVENH